MGFEKMHRLKIMSLLLLALLISSCGSRDITVERAKRAAQKKGDIIIGVAWPFSYTKDLFREGIDMAVAEINAGGGVTGRNIRIIYGDDEASVTKGRLVAQHFADDTDIVAVIGHFNSYVSIPASRIYEFSGLIMLSPGSTSPALTRQGFKRVFRNIPTDEEIGRHMVDFAVKRGYNQMIVYYADNDYGEGLATAFEGRAGEVDLAIVDRLSYDGISKKEFRAALSKWKDFEFDAIFLAGSVPEAATFIAEAREMDVTIPILGGDGLDSPELLEIAGKAAEGVVVGSVFATDIPCPNVQRFNEGFEEKYGVLPDTWAAQGYDAVKLLSHAMEKAGTTVPDKVADMLRSTKNWQGVTGLHTFDGNGDVVGKAIIIKVVRNGGFQYLDEKQHSTPDAGK